MRLGLIINEYRNKSGMSMEEFSKRSGLSKAYIGFLEKGFHPKTMNQIKPSVDAIKKCADAMGMDFTTLFNMLDETITLNPSSAESENVIDDEEEELLTLFRGSSQEIQNAALAVLKAGQHSPGNPQ